MVALVTALLSKLLCRIVENIGRCKMKNMGRYIAVSFFDISADVLVSLITGNLVPLANN
jgi:hypothetical protein